MDTLEEPVHITTLKYIARSPAHYLAALRNKSDSSSKRLGRLVHQIILGGPPSSVWDGERRGKAWLEFKESNKDREIVTRSEVEQATQIANAVLASPLAAPYLVGKTEHAVEWRMNGRKCATRGIDCLGDGFITELKTASTTEPGRFRRAALAMGYHAQLAFYQAAAASIGRRDIHDAYIVAVETTDPYAVTVMHLGQAALEEGAKLVRLWLERLQACEEANEWPSYAQHVVEFEVEDGFNLIIDGEEVAA